MLCGINVCDYDMRLGTKTELELNGLLINVQVDPLAHVTIQKADGPSRPCIGLLAESQHFNFFSWTSHPFIGLFANPEP